MLVSCVSSVTLSCSAGKAEATNRPGWVPPVVSASACESAVVQLHIWKFSVAVIGCN